jgi:hypothetical protein
VDGFVDKPDLALKYLERKKKDEFSVRTELTGADGEDLFAISAEEKENINKKLNGIL